MTTSGRADGWNEAPTGRKPGTQTVELWHVDLAGGRTLLCETGIRQGVIAEAGVAPEASAASNAERYGAHVALRVLLCGAVGPDVARRPFRVDATGKPRLDTANPADTVEFSLAHCDGAALIGLSRAGAIGVDIEAARGVRIRAERRALLEAAAGSLAPAVPLPDGPPDDRFLQAWVRLEAFAKATGEGVGRLFGRLSAFDGSASWATPGAGAPSLAVQDIKLSSRSRLFAAVAGPQCGLATLGGAPAVQTLPLSQNWLAARLTGQTSDN